MNTAIHEWQGNFPAKNDKYLQERFTGLSDIASRLLAIAKTKGADQAEVACSDSGGLNVNVRMGEVETLEYNQDRGMGITVYLGQSKGSANTADFGEASLQATVEQAIAIAKFTEADPYSGLAERDWLATQPQDFETWFPSNISAQQGIDLALECETAGRDYDSKISNSDGASFSTGSGLSVYANSLGFIGGQASTHHSLGCALIAGVGDQMERDGWYDFRIDASALSSPKEIGIESAKRALSRLQSRSIKTGEYPVVFENQVARGLLGSLLGAISGSSQYRKMTFFPDCIDQLVLPSWISITEQPFLKQGLNSAWFDGDGVATQATDLITGGKVARYLLGTYSARKLGLKSTGNASGAHNLKVSANMGDLTSILKEMKTGFLVTQVMGQGVNSITGDYSRGASGFWVENGEIQYPVDGVTIAGNLRDMYSSITAIGNDVDHRSQHQIGSVWISKMMVAGDSQN